MSALSGDAPIITWNVAFERSVIGELAEHLPDRREALQSIQERLVDLMPVFQKWYLHPDCSGSASIKVVGKAVLGEAASYGNLPVAAGDEAYLAWHRLVFEKNADAKTAEHLEAYCAQDTLLPLKLIDELRKLQQ